MVAPFTKAPALLAKNKQLPATSSGSPVRLRGTAFMIFALSDWKNEAVILVVKGPQASVLLTGVSNKPRVR